MKTHLNEIGKLNYPNIEPKESNSKHHFYFSIIKSLLRILGYSFLFSSYIQIAGFVLIFAEFLGILEEFDFSQNK